MPQDKVPGRVPLHQLFFPLLKIGALTFGGGFSMIPFIEHEIVQKRAWLSKEEFLDTLASAQTIPGAIAINTATFVGMTLAGKRGAILACIAVVLPAFVIMSVVAMGLQGFQENPWVLAMFRGVRWAVTALILSAAWKVGHSLKKDYLAWILAFASLVLLLFTNVHGALILIGGGGLGLLLGWKIPESAAKVKEKDSSLGVPESRENADGKEHKGERLEEPFPNPEDPREDE